MRQASVEARFLPGLIFLPTLGIAAVLLVGGREAIAGNLTIGEFTLFVTLLLQLVWPLEALGWIINLGQRATAAASRSFAWLDGIEPLPEPASPAAAAARPAAGRASRTSTSATATGAEVLAGVDLEVEPGEIVAVCGPTGAGQDVAAQPAAALLRPDRRARARRRRRRARRVARGAASRGRDRDAEARAVLDPAPRQPARRAAGRGLERRARRVRGGRRVADFVERPAGRLRHADRRARRQPLRRPAPARGARARAHRGRARDRARRPDVGRRHRDGATSRGAPAPRRRAAGRCSSRASGCRRCSSPTARSSCATAASSRQGLPEDLIRAGGPFAELFGDEALAA